MFFRMVGNKEAPAKQPEQPRLEAADGTQVQWPAATAEQEIPVFLKAVGERQALMVEKHLKAERNRKNARKGMRKLRSQGQQ